MPLQSSDHDRPTGSGMGGLPTGAGGLSTGADGPATGTVRSTHVDEVAPERDR